MTDSYKVGYSVDALDDLREIYSYIANELLVPETATAQLGRIRKEVRSLDFMPAHFSQYRECHKETLWSYLPDIDGDFLFRSPFLQNDGRVLAPRCRQYNQG